MSEMPEPVLRYACANCGEAPATVGRLCAACDREYEPRAESPDRPDRDTWELRERERIATHRLRAATAVIAAARKVVRTRTPESYNAAVERLAKALEWYDAAEGSEH